MRDEDETPTPHIYEIRIIEYGKPGSITMPLWSLSDYDTVWHSLNDWIEARDIRNEQQREASGNA